LLAGPAASAQDTAASSDSSTRPLGPRAPKPPPNPFAVASWASLEEPASSIRSPSQMDLAAREDRNYIQVYGHKKGHGEQPLYRRIDGGAPAWSEAAVPRELPLINPTNCSNEAYQTIGGQAATGADMIGALARGC
jgi:hypothetical protein